jgi:cellulose synthase/poly-beta-1,6-N-acetylglucosamine synthase-like glycosyltransferase
MELAAYDRAAVDRVEALLRKHAAKRPPPRPVMPSLCPELECVRSLIGDDAIAAVTRRAMTAGTGGDRALLASGLYAEEDYVRALAASLGLRFESFGDNISRKQCPLGDDHLIDAAATGLLPLRIDGELVFVIAPRVEAAKRMAIFGGPDPRVPGRALLTTSERLTAFVRRHTEDALGERATLALHRKWPELSAAPPRWRRSLIPASLIGVALLFALVIAPGPITLGFEIALALVFLGWMILRIAGALMPSRRKRSALRLSEAELPIYTVMVALYRETAALPGLIAALRKLDYPAEKLDIKLVVEPDDQETRDALAKLRLAPPFEVIVAPAAGPRTKPKALNAALPFARGTFTVIFDAEDRPEPDQLRHALDLFRSHGPSLACVQASLTIDNVADNWITGLFAAEYAGLFDVFLPALAALNLPLPLGGSSNHLHTKTLRKVGAWDPFNVTEDADLGLRLARFGYRAVVTSSTTYEEAPGRLTAWLKQRTRWFKGWMQTWLVHMREPLRLRRDIGSAAFITVQLMVGGNVLAALVHPVLLLGLFWQFLSGELVLSATGTSTLFALTLFAGYMASALLCLVGLFRRGLMAHAWVLLGMPLHWLMLSWAAWRALYQLVRDPYRWEKTEHGLARTSRQAPRRPVDAIIAEILRPAVARP